MLSEKRRFQCRLANRTYRHGNWRQVVVDCGGMCTNCYAVRTLEFHEPFGEDKYGWGKFQTRVLLCHDCHSLEHEKMFAENRNIQPSRLMEDVDIEIIMEGGYNNWIKNHNLIDRFAYLTIMREEWNGKE